MEEQRKVEIRKKQKNIKTLTRHSFNLYSVLLLILNTFCYTTRVLQEKNKTTSIVSNTKATNLVILVFNNTIMCKNSIDIFIYFNSETYCNYTNIKYHIHRSQMLTKKLETFLHFSFSLHCVMH